MRPIKRLLLPMALSAVVVSGLALAQPEVGSCCVQSTSALDAKMAPTLGSDENFFSTGSGGPPNVLFVVDTSGSMNDWPVRWGSTKGCNSYPTPADTSRYPKQAGYDSTKSYPGLYTGFTGSGPGPRTPTEHADWFNRTKFYQLPSNDFGQNFGGGMSGPSGTSYSTLTGMSGACSWAAGASSGPDYTECVSCVNTDGFYVFDSSRRVASGNFLNYYGPRDFSAMNVLSHIIFETREVRMAMMGITNYGGGGSGNCFSGAGSGSSCSCLWTDWQPNCNQSSPMDQSAVENNKRVMLGYLSQNGTWGGCGTPLADLLYSGAHYFRSKSPDGFTALGIPTSYSTDTDFDEKTSTNQKSICFSCGFNAMILITDGEPNDEHISIPSAISGVTTTPDCPSSNRYCSSSKADNVAKWAWTNDLRADHTGSQKVATYTVGFAVDSATATFLAGVAKVGGGKAYVANSAAELQNAIVNVLADVKSRNVAFSSSSVSTVQSGSAALGAIIPRVGPRVDEPWRGTLWRFNQFNEFVEGTFADGGIADLNQDGDATDTFLVDSAGDIVVENDEGLFIKKGTSTAATQYWEANARLNSLGHTARNIYTVRDTHPSGATTGDGSFTNSDSLTAFTISNWNTLRPYLGITGTAFCPTTTPTLGDMLTKWGITVSAAAGYLSVTLSGTPTQPELDELCVKALIQYVRGMDLGDADRDGNRTETREYVLGDIFHSSPVVVDPPMDKFLCNLGLGNQCARTLFSQSGIDAPTLLASYNSQTDCANTATADRDAYDRYVWVNRKRDKYVLAGANDGMLHAFHNGDATETCTGGQSTVSYNAGTGDERWAFIPPDLLPRLRDSVLGHAYLVDGDLMVRDVWADGSGAATADGQKQADEYHTLAVVAEGRGGTHYFALELTFDATTGNLNTSPSFRWMWPQPCSPESAQFGKTFMSLAPKPPPIGPVLIDRSTLPGSPPAGRSNYGVTTLETWVVALSGGWSPGLERGRGVYVVDAWNGTVNGRNDNLWWKFDYDDSASSEQLGAKKYLVHSVPAPVALVDYGANSDPRQDGFFDTALFGDTAGQLWVARMQTPGRLDSTTKLINNWSGGRAFQSDRFSTATPSDDVGGVVDADPDDSMLNLNPFYMLPSSAIEPGTNALRAFIGTGNRYALLEDKAGVCRFDNLQACSKYKCSNVAVKYEIEKRTFKFDDAHTHWGDRAYKHSRENTGSASKSACGTPGSTEVVAKYSDYVVQNCDLTAGTDPNPGDLNKVEYRCGLSSDGGVFLCNRVDSTTLQLGPLFDTTSVNTTGLGFNRFYGVWAYGGAAARYFDETATSGADTARDFDDRRLTDRNTDNPTAGDLVNVTNTSCIGANVCSGSVGDGGWGWVLDYPTLDTKTATGGVVLGGAVLWSSVALDTAASSAGVCGSLPVASSRLWQGDYITGEPNAAYGFVNPDGGAWFRFQQRNILAPPPEPATTVQISKTGQIRYTAMIVEPGKDQATDVDVAGTQDVLQLVYELPISRSLHNCRHADGGCLTAP